MGSSGIKVTPTNVTSTSANLSVAVRVNNEKSVSDATSVSVAIKDASGALITTLTGTVTPAAGTTAVATVTGTVSNPHLWKGVPDPYLYTATATITDPDGPGVTDVRTVSFGFRAYSASSSGFTLNGSTYDLHGINRHQDRLNKGWAISNSDMDSDMSLIMEMGVTTIRTAHYPNAQYWYDLCDKKGLVAWVEVPFVGTSSNGFPS